MSAAGPRVVLVIENIALARDHRLRKQATALLAAGARVSVVCRRDPGNADCVPGVRVLDYPAPREGAGKVDFLLEYAYSLVMAAWAVLRIFVRQGFDVLQVSSTPDIYFTLAAPYRLLGRRVIFDFKDLSPETYQARYGRTDGFFYRTLLWMERASLRTADHVLVVNDALREIAQQRGGVVPEHITLVGNGPPLAAIDPRPARAELRGPWRHLCVWVGFISPQDHLDLAIRAMAQLRELGRTDCGLVVIGVGDAVPDLEQLVAELDLADQVTFTGWRDPAEVAEYLATADLGIEPGIEHFVSPVTAMEFMAAGLPFVAFDVRETRALAERPQRTRPRATCARWPTRSTPCYRTARAARNRRKGSREGIAGMGAPGGPLRAARAGTGRTVSARGRRARGGRAMSPIRPASLLRVHGAWVLTCTLLVLAGAYAYTALAPVRYLSEASVVVESQVSPNTTPIAPAMGTEKRVASSGVVIDRAAATLGLSPVELGRRISVGVPPDTHVLSIDCTAPSPQAAQRCAQVVADAYVVQPRP